jgi:hypothetical protein
MKTYLSLSLLILGFIITGCNSSYKILKPEQEKDFRLSDYPTFGFYEIEAEGDTNSQTFEKNIGLIKEAISAALQQRGLNETRDPALTINIALSVKNEVQTRQTDFRTDGLPRYMGQRRYSWKSEEVEVGRYREGTLLIDFVDSANNKMVWKGGSKGVLPTKTNDLSKEINQIINEVIAGIPK